MNYLEFLSAKPVLFGSTMHNGKQKIGSYQPAFNRYSNRIEYQFYTEKGNKGKGGFTLKRAFDLFSSGLLSFDPESGKKENYV